LEESTKVQIYGIGQVKTPYGPVPALLLEDDRERVLVVIIGNFEASSIAAALQGFKFPAPNTHDFMMNVLKELNATIKRGEVYGLQENRFLAKLVLDVSGEEIEIEGRPSDVIALTVRAGVRIYVAEKVMKETSVKKSTLMKGTEKNENLE